MRASFSCASFSHSPDCLTLSCRCCSDCLSRSSFSFSSFSSSSSRFSFCLMRASFSSVNFSLSCNFFIMSWVWLAWSRNSVSIPCVSISLCCRVSAFILRPVMFRETPKISIILPLISRTGVRLVSVHTVDPSLQRYSSWTILDRILGAFLEYSRASSSPQMVLANSTDSGAKISSSSCSIASSTVKPRNCSTDGLT